MSSREQVKELVLNSLSTLFDPKHPPVVNGQANPRYLAYLEAYMEALTPFAPWELSAGAKLARESWKYKTWPLPAEMRNFCLEAQRSARPQSTEPPKYLQHRDRREMTPEERERVRWKLNVLWEWFGNGTLRHRTLAECTAEAARRQAASASRRLSQAS